MRIFALLMTLLMVSGCASDSLVQRAYNESAGKPEGYRVGKADGCSSALKERAYLWKGEFKRDDARMKSDGDYALGWADGYRGCDYSVVH